MRHSWPPNVPPHPTSSRCAVRDRLLAGPPRSAALKRVHVERADGCAFATSGAGHEQRALGQPVAGIERALVESVRREGVGEPTERVGPDRLGAIEGDAPGAEIEVDDRPPLLSLRTHRS